MSVCDKLVKIIHDLFLKNDTPRLNAQHAPDGVKEIDNIDYFGDGLLAHLLDVYLPENLEEGKKLPVVIDIHGGAWIYGDKDLNKYYAMEYAVRGFAVVNISYRLISEGGTYPAIKDDIFAAFKWIKDNAKDYPFDMKNIFLTGDSAGGHLAALATAITTDEELAKLCEVNVPFKFNAVAFTCGVFDIERFPKITPVRHLFKLFLGKEWRKSPMLKYLSIKNTKVENFPPVFLNTGAKDFIRKQSLAFYEVLQERGVESELLDYKKEDATHKLDHVYNVLYPTYPECVNTNDMIADWFKQNLK